MTGRQGNDVFVAIGGETAQPVKQDQLTAGQNASRRRFGTILTRCGELRQTRLDKGAMVELFQVLGVMIELRVARLRLLGDRGCGA